MITARLGSLTFLPPSLSLPPSFAPPSLYPPQLIPPPHLPGPTDQRHRALRLPSLARHARPHHTLPPVLPRQPPLWTGNLWPSLLGRVCQSQESCAGAVRPQHRDVCHQGECGREGGSGGGRRGGGEREEWKMKEERTWGRQRKGRREGCGYYAIIRCGYQLSELSVDIINSYAFSYFW